MPVACTDALAWPGTATAHDVALRTRGRTPVACCQPLYARRFADGGALRKVSFRV